MATTAEKLLLAFPDLAFSKLPLPSEFPAYQANPFNPGSILLKKGHVKNEGRRPFGSDTIFDRDVAIEMRDGVTIYTDIFRPAGSDMKPVPALLPWSPYGKTGAGPQELEKMGPFRIGIPLSRTSGYEKFEAPDPGEWSERGFAVVNVDARGAGASEGDIAFWGQQEAEDIYDTIDWLSKRTWCNGSVAMIGNSWLAVSQINFASRLSHPALKALAPMEGLNDLYRDVMVRGGMPTNTPFIDQFLIPGFAGPSSVENPSIMLKKRPLFDDYWQSKHVATENIDHVALYLVASYSSMLHSKGSFHTYRTAETTKKWLRVHHFQEWYDLYRPEVNNELQMFLDFYCKGIANGWESTPPIRLSLLAFDESPAKTVVDRPEQEYPLNRQQLKKFYLDAADMRLSSSVAQSSATASHAGHDLNAKSRFTLHFNESVELAGYPSVRLWMSCSEADDMDVVVQIRKISSTGRLLTSVNYPCPVPGNMVADTNVAKTTGPQGFLRASHAVSKVPQLCQENEVFYQHDRRQAIPRGAVVPLDITLWPIGMVFDKGEGIVLRVSGHDMCYPEIEALRYTQAPDENFGTHSIRTGGKYDSHVILPVVPSF